MSKHWIPLDCMFTALFYITYKLSSRENIHCICFMAHKHWLKMSSMLNMFDDQINNSKTKKSHMRVHFLTENLIKHNWYNNLSLFPQFQQKSKKVSHQYRAMYMISRLTALRSYKWNRKHVKWNISKHEIFPNNETFLQTVTATCVKVSDVSNNTETLKA